MFNHAVTRSVQRGKTGTLNLASVSTSLKSSAIHPVSLNERAALKGKNMCENKT